MILHCIPQCSLGEGPQEKSVSCQVSMHVPGMNVLSLQLPCLDAHKH